MSTQVAFHGNLCHLIRLGNIRIPPPAAIAAAIAAIAAATWGWRRLIETTGGPVIALLADGTLLSGRFRVIPLGGDRCIAWRRIGARDGAGQDNSTFGRLSLQPAGAVFAVRTIETFGDGFDMRVTLHESETGAVRFSTTDNAYPRTVWSGDDPTAPAPLLEEQALVDRLWAEDRIDNPDLPRPIATARFDDPAADGELLFAGWTAAGHALLLGRSRLNISSPAKASEIITDLVNWWGVAGPVAGGGWGWLVRDHGARPADHAPVARPPLARAVALVDGQLRVGGVVQTDAVLAGGIDAVDGPFS